MYDEMDGMIQRNATMVQNQTEYNRQFDTLTAKCNAQKERLKALNSKLMDINIRRSKLEKFVSSLEAGDGLAGFDEQVFIGTVDQIVVNRGAEKGDKILTFRFKDGTGITVTV